MPGRKTRIGRVFGLWGLVFILTVFLVARPTGFTWPYWLYGLIWGTATSALHYAFRNFFEEREYDSSGPPKN
jgi:hypothetical protein